VTDVAGSSPAAGPTQAQSRRSIGDTIGQTEINFRLFGMLVALGVILVVFHFWSGGTFLRPDNMISLAVQGSGIAVIATGMVLVIVSRNIDLSVGSIVGITAMTYAVLMTEVLPNVVGLAGDFPFRWVVALAIGLLLGLGIGALQGFIIAYIGVPSFIVTLGGLLSIRGVIWYFSKGAAVSGLDDEFKLIGGGAQGSIGGPATWAVAAVAALLILGLIYYNRRQRRRFGFPLRPVWAEIVLASLGVLFVFALAWVANNSFWPRGLAEEYARQNNIPIPEGGLRIPVGFPYPVVIVIGVTLVMTWVATRRRYGRYVYAYGGNPEAADLAGINTRWTIMKTFMLIGFLCAIGGAIAAARLNAATLDIGVSYELYVIAAAVVGGTSFAGGVGTIPGAVLGAFVMQSIAYGLSYVGVNSPGQNVVAGIVLILAVGFDTWNRRRGS
jgi:D-xylose transport system permease protein